jgi:hypothetical protein
MIFRSLRFGMIKKCHVYEELLEEEAEEEEEEDEEDTWSLLDQVPTLSPLVTTYATNSSFAAYQELGKLMIARFVLIICWSIISLLMDYTLCCTFAWYSCLVEDIQQN